MPDSGHYRARQLYPILGNCELCDTPALDRHHKDGNEYNNSRSNLMFSCRRHHMEVDGRLGVFMSHKAKPKAKVIKSCIICGRFYFPLRKGRCHACNEYWRRNGKERPLICVDCGRKLPAEDRHERCRECKRKRQLKMQAAYQRRRRAKLRAK